MWQEKDKTLYKKFVFADFAEAFEFMQAVAELAEEQGHHPTWLNAWNTVEIWLSTHDSGGVTEKDHQLAKAIDGLHKDSQPAERVALKEAKLYTDGGSRGNPGPSAYGFAILDLDGNVVKKYGEYLGITTNNQAEYQSLKHGIESAISLGARKLYVYMDSMLVINQMKGVYKVKNRDLWPIYNDIKEAIKAFSHIEFTHVPREHNKLADTMVNEALDAAIKSQH